jgi:DNA polymerase IV
VQRIILHIDFDSFFASVEQQDNPLYRNRPLGVTATNGRTCIIAASREAKKLGIKSPSNTYDAKRICPAIIFIPAHFNRYWEISKKFLKMCDNFSPVVEMFSLDEVFMDVTLTAKLFGGVEGLIKQFKKRLRLEVGEYITASVGISHNKLLAKLASGLKKPNGVMAITPENVWEVYASAKLTDVCGIGFRIEKRLHQLGIYSLLQLRAAPLAALVAEFGEVEGHFLKAIGLAQDLRPVIPYTQFEGVKSVGRQYCLPYNEYDKRKILQNVYELCEEVALKLRRLEKKARTAGLYLGGSTTIHGRQTTGYYFDSGQTLFNLCLRIIADQLDGYVRRIGIGVSNLQTTTLLPSPLLLTEQKKEKVTKVIDMLNDKFGDHTIRNGFLLYADKLTTVPNGYGTDQYERQKLARLSDG